MTHLPLVLLPVTIIAVAALALPVIRRLGVVLTRVGGMVIWGGMFSSFERFPQWGASLPAWMRRIFALPLLALVLFQYQHERLSFAAALLLLTGIAVIRTVLVVDGSRLPVLLATWSRQCAIPRYAAQFGQHHVNLAIAKTTVRDLVATDPHLLIAAFRRDIWSISAVLVVFVQRGYPEPWVSMVACVLALQGLLIALNGYGRRIDLSRISETTWTRVAVVFIVVMTPLTLFGGKVFSVLCFIATLVLLIGAMARHLWFDLLVIRAPEILERAYHMPLTDSDVRRRARELLGGSHAGLLRHALPLFSLRLPRPPHVRLDPYPFLMRLDLLAALVLMIV